MSMKILLFASVCLVTARLLAQKSEVLQPLAAAPGVAPVTLSTGAQYYLPATLDTIRWGYLPAADGWPALSVPSGSIVTFDTISHEGILEDQGRDPVRFFGGFGVPREQVLTDAIAITASSLAHDFAKDGPHIVIGPVAVNGAEPGDVLKIEFVSFTPRVPYGVISNRHGKGALPGEFPETGPPDPAANAVHPELYRNDAEFVPVRMVDGKIVCTLADGRGGKVEFAGHPFLGTVGLTPAAQSQTNSIPPGDFGGNLDIHYLVAGTSLYLPVQVKGAGLFVADPHFAQGNGEVSLTAVEGSLRATLKLTVLKQGAPDYPTRQPLKVPFAETPEFWIVTGLDPDLNEAMKKAVRNAVDYLSTSHNMARAAALAYLSAATDFEVSQVVDRTKGVHALIRKSDFEGVSGREK